MLRIHSWYQGDVTTNKTKPQDTFIKYTNAIVVLWLHIPIYLLGDHIYFYNSYLLDCSETFKGKGDLGIGYAKEGDISRWVYSKCKDDVQTVVLKHMEHVVAVNVITHV